jgi:transcriptional regulator
VLSPVAFLPRISKRPPSSLYRLRSFFSTSLKTLTSGPRHGYAVARSIEETSADAVLVEEGSLYPALYRLERRGWVEAEWGTSELGRRAKLYRLTDAGREHLAAEMLTWKRFAAGVSKVLFST